MKDRAKTSDTRIASISIRVVLAVLLGIALVSAVGGCYHDGHDRDRHEDRREHHEDRDRHEEHHDGDHR